MKKLLIIGHVWPEPCTTAAGHRMLQLIRAFIHFGYQITFGSTAVKTSYSYDLEALGVNTVPLKLNHSSFDTFIQEFAPSVVVFDRFIVEEQFGWRVAEFAPNTLRILNTEDLHALRRAREDCHKKNIPFTLDHWCQNEKTKREVASIYRSDLSLMVSTFEMELLTQTLHVPQTILLHLPFMLEEIKAEQQNNWPGFEVREGFITYGNGKHAPNIDAILYLKETLWPLIRKQLPKAQLKIYGAYLPKPIEQMHNPKEGFHVLGWVENLDAEIQKARICLAPLRFGAGIKGKLMDAINNGTPTVTTSIGVEGMQGTVPWPGIVTDVPINFAAQAVALYQNKTLWQKTQVNGLELVHTDYNKAVLQNRLKEAVGTIAKNIDSHRNQNFIGQLLQYHTLTSTKYMAKWIEEKHKK